MMMVVVEQKEKGEEGIGGGRQRSKEQLPYFWGTQHEPEIFTKHFIFTVSLNSHENTMGQADKISLIQQFGNDS